MTDTSGHLDYSAQERVDLWEESLETIQRYPITGVGYGTYGLLPHPHGLKDSHNVYVKITYETGVIGLALSLLLLGMMFASSFRLYRVAEDPMFKGLGLGLALATICYAITNFFGDRWNYIEISAPLWLLVAAALRAHSLACAPAKIENAQDAGVGVRTLAHRKSMHAWRAKAKTG